MEPEAELADTTTSKSPTAEMFARARDFEISSGIFINQISNGSRPPAVTPQKTRIPASIMLPRAISAVEHEVYAQLLLPRRKGYPLWNPKPDERLPAEYRREGVRIGDIGILNEFGGFDYLFNACLPADDPTNAGRVPVGFKRISDFSGRDIRGPEQAYRPGSYVASRDSDFRRGIIEVNKRAKGVPREVGGGFVFRSTAHQGAILVLPEGGVREDHLNLSLFANYAADCAKSWYDYINGPLGRRAHNGSLYIVTGCDKARCWGVASFAGSEPGSVYLEYVPISPESHSGDSESKPEYEFRVSDCASTDSGSDSTFGNTSGCVFVRGFKIAIRPWSFWNLVTGAVDVSSITDLEAQDLLPRSHTQPFLPPRPIIEEFPSKHRNHDAEVVLTHDDQWCSILSELDECMPTDDELVRRLAQFEIVLENGYARLGPKVTAEMPHESTRNTPQKFGFPKYSDNLTLGAIEARSNLFGGSTTRRRYLSSPSLRGNIHHSRSPIRTIPHTPVNIPFSNRSRSLSISSPSPGDSQIEHPGPHLLVSPPTPSPEHMSGSGRIGPYPLEEHPRSPSDAGSPSYGYLSATASTFASSPPSSPTTDESFTLYSSLPSSPESTNLSLGESPPPSIRYVLEEREFPSGSGPSVLGSEGGSGSGSGSSQLLSIPERPKSPRGRKHSMADTPKHMLNPSDLIVHRWRKGLDKDPRSSSREKGQEEGEP